MPRWTRVIGDGLVYEGPCLLKHLVFWPDADGDYADIYDGRDKTSGKKFMRIETSITLTWQIAFVDGVQFDTGIYVDGKDSAVEVTVVFEPL